MENASEEEKVIGRVIRAGRNKHVESWFQDSEIHVDALSSDWFCRCHFLNCDIYFSERIKFPIFFSCDFDSCQFFNFWEGALSNSAGDCIFIRCRQEPTSEHTKEAA